MPEERLADYLDLIDRQIMYLTYDVWQAAYSRGLVTCGELIRFLTFYEAQYRARQSCWI